MDTFVLYTICQIVEEHINYHPPHKVKAPRLEVRHFTLIPFDNYNDNPLPIPASGLSLSYLSSDSAHILQNPVIEQILFVFLLKDIYNLSILQKNNLITITRHLRIMRYKQDRLPHLLINPG